MSPPNAGLESLWPFGPRGFESLSRRQTYVAERQDYADRREQYSCPTRSKTSLTLSQNGISAYLQPKGFTALILPAFVTSLAILTSTFLLARIRLKLETSGALRGSQFTFPCPGQLYLLHRGVSSFEEMLRSCPLAMPTPIRQLIGHHALCAASFAILWKTLIHRTGERISGYMFAPESASRLS